MISSVVNLTLKNVNNLVITQLYKSYNNSVILLLYKLYIIKHLITNIIIFLI